MRNGVKWLENDGKNKNRLSHSIELKCKQNHSILPWLLGVSSTKNERN